MLRHALVSFATIGLGSAVVSAATILVPGDHATIQEAIDDANTFDEIIVGPGTYFEAINFLGKSIYVHSSGGPDVTTIDATGLLTSVVTCADDETSDTILEGFTLKGGTGTSSGGTLGGGMFNFFAQPVVLNCIFRGNTAADGGAVANLGSTPKFYNCLFYANTATRGGAVYSGFSTPTLANCTITNNSATSTGGGFYSTNSSPLVMNTIVWNNPGGAFAGGTVPNTPNFTYCDVDTPVAGAGNISVTPLFFDVVGGDLRLQSTSPCIDAGNSSAIATLIQLDLDQENRAADVSTAADTGVPVFGLVADMGAYEYQSESSTPSCPGDADQNGEVGFGDIIMVLINWGLCP